MDITFIVIAAFLFLAVFVLLFFLFKSFNKKSYIADDGSIFQNKSDLDLYNSLYEKTKPLFSSVEDVDPSPVIQGFDKKFLRKLKTEGFHDLKTLIIYRDQIKLLLDLINT